MLPEEVESRWALILGDLGRLVAHYTEDRDAADRATRCRAIDRGLRLLAKGRDALERARKVL
jgi:hypothetical protein